MKPFHMVYQPKFFKNKLVSVEALLRTNDASMNIEEYIRAFKDPMILDMSVIDQVLIDIEVYKDIPHLFFSINVSYFSFLNEKFIEFCLTKLQGVNVYLELTEYFEIIALEKLKHNFMRLKQAGIKISLDDFGKDFARSDLIIALVFDQIKIDMSLIRNIEDDYGSFKHLSFVTEKIQQLGIDNIVFEGIETEKQKNLINLFCDDAIFQGYFFARPMKLEDIFKKFKLLTETPLKKKDDKEDQIKKLVYEMVVNNNSQEINEQIKNIDIFKLIYNHQPEKTIENYKNVYNTKFDHLTINTIKCIMDSSKRMLVVRNADGTVIFENDAHKEFFDMSTVGLNKDILIQKFPDYRKCLEDDYSFMNSGEFFSVSREIFGNSSYISLRQKSFFNENCFIFNTVNEEKHGSICYRDPLTGCYLRDAIDTYKKPGMHINKIVVYIDLDGFKNVNDSFGNRVGDECLINFVNFIKVNLKLEESNDTMIRIGGDEFILFLNTSDIYETKDRLISIRKNTEDLFQLKEIDLSFSFGLSINKYNDIELAIDEADQNMYLEKRQRREKCKVTAEISL